jgi:hypothetical protein
MVDNRIQHLLEMQLSSVRSPWEVLKLLTIKQGADFGLKTS